MTLAAPWYARHAWLVFVLFGVLALLFGLSGEAGPLASDAPLGALVAGDRTEEGMDAQLSGSFALGMGVFGIFIAASAYRRFQRWSWFAMCLWPVFFAWHIVAFGTWLPDGVFFLLGLVALALPVGRFLRATETTPEASGPEAS